MRNRLHFAIFSWSPWVSWFRSAYSCRGGWDRINEEEVGNRKGYREISSRTSSWPLLQLQCQTRWSKKKEKVYIGTKKKCAHICLKLGPLISSQFLEYFLLYLYHSSSSSRHWKLWEFRDWPAFCIWPSTAILWHIQKPAEQPYSSPRTVLDFTHTLWS